MKRMAPPHSVNFHFHKLDDVLTISYLEIEMAYNTIHNAMERETTEYPSPPGGEKGWLEATTNSSNSTLSTSEELTSKQVAVIIILGTITLVTILANSFVLYIFAVGKRRLRNPTNLLLANLAVADLLVGLIVMPLLAAPTILGGKWIFGDLACQAFDYIHFLLCAASMWSMVGVGVERFIGVSRPLQYKYIITRNRTMLLIIFIWLAAVGLTSGPLTYWPKMMSGVSTICFVNLGRNFLLFIIFFVYWIPISGTIIIYLLVYRHAVAPFINSPGGGGSSKNKSEDGSVAKQKQIRLAKSIAIVTGTLFFFFCPVFLTFTIKTFDSPYFTVDLLFLAAWIRYSCSTVNPFLYGLAVPGYRQEIKERLFGISKRGNRLEDSMTQSYVTGSQGGQNGIEEPPKAMILDTKSTTMQRNKRSRFCTQCGNLMKDFVANKNARCDKCHRKILCASWMLPTTWENPAYFMCPNCPTIRFFDGAEPCFCQNCSHKFSPVQSRPPLERLTSLVEVTRKPPQQITVTPQIPSINLTDVPPRAQPERKNSDAEDRANVIRRLKNSVIVPYLEQRRSQLVSNNNLLGTGTPNQTNSVSLRELEEIVAQLEQTFGMDIDDHLEEN